MAWILRGLNLDMDLDVQRGIGGDVVMRSLRQGLVQVFDSTPVLEHLEV